MYVSGRGYPDPVEIESGCIAGEPALRRNACRVGQNASNQTGPRLPAGREDRTTAFTQRPRSIGTRFAGHRRRMPPAEGSLPPCFQVLVMAKDSQRLRLLADYVLLAGGIAYCARSLEEAVTFLKDGMRPSSVLVDPVLGAEVLDELRTRIRVTFPDLILDVKSTPP